MPTSCATNKLIRRALAQSLHKEHHLPWTVAEEEQTPNLVVARKRPETARERHLAKHHLSKPNTNLHLVPTESSQRPPSHPHPGRRRWRRERREEPGRERKEEFSEAEKTRGEEGGRVFKKNGVVCILFFCVCSETTSSSI
jgi:hypothetical protein